MAKLNAFFRDPKAMRDGEWIDPGPQYLGIELRCRALGYSYVDAVQSRTKREARKHGGEDKIPAAVRARINIESMADVGLLDIRGLTENDGTPITIDRFKELLLDPESGYSDDFSTLAFECCQMVGRRIAEDVSDAKGNLPQLSAVT